MIRAFQWDLARQVERLDWLQQQLPRYAAWGYQELYLHLEDAVEYPRLPGVARADAYRYRQLAQLVDSATNVGLKVVPIVNLLGHTQYLIKHPDLRDLNELRAADGSALERGQICPLHPRTLEIAEKLLEDVRPFCTAGKVHVGLDESFHLGKHPLSQKEISEVGLAAHFSGYVNRLHRLTQGFGLRMGIWADMLCFLPEAVPLLPRGLIAYDWYYYPFRRQPRIEMFNFKPYDLAPALQAQGIEYWGCPMNGSFRYEPLPVFRDRLGNIRAWWQRCAETKAAGMLVTSWEPSRLALPMTTVVDAAAASLWLDPDAIDARMLTAGFERAFDLDRSAARKAAHVALGCDRYSFTGYARWEANERWDAVSARENLRPYARGRNFFSVARRKTLPQPFAFSISLLKFLYARDLFVRQSARDVFRLRKAIGQRRGTSRLLAQMRSRAEKFSVDLTNGRQAARAMWRLTRNRHERGPNERILQDDAARLHSWRSWLKRCAKSPNLAFTSCVMVGRQQLTIEVFNFAPALQKVIVEHQQADGRWRELRSRFTIEFVSGGASTRSKIKRDFSVPVDAANGAPPALRIIIRGLGQVKIGRVELTDGLTTHRPIRWPRRRYVLLGQKAPHRGFPELDWTSTANVLPLMFKPRSSPTKKRTFGEVRS